MPLLCPFNSAFYLAGFPHLGLVDCRASAPAALLRRPIPGSSAFDGLGPWPYLWVDDARQIATLRDAFADLLTLAFVTQPGFRPESPDSDAIYLKDHYIYDPALPYPVFSGKTRSHLRRAVDAWEFGIVSGFEDRLAIYLLYQELKQRRGLSRGFFDFPRLHFETLASLAGALFFSVRDNQGVAAMACAVVFGEWIQLLHIAVSDRGLRSEASYALMNSILGFAAKERRLLVLGGIPHRGDEGLTRFKARWSNRREPVFLHRIINDRAAYAELVSGRKSNTYFPAYRSASWPQHDLMRMERGADSVLTISRELDRGPPL